MAELPHAPPSPQRPLWQRRWFQVLLATILGLVLASFVLPPLFLLIYELRGVLLPVVIGFGLAYVANPLITFLERRARVPRWAGTSGIMIVGLASVFLFLLLVVPPLVQQGTELFLKLKEVYPQEIVELVAELRTPDLPSNTQTPLPEDALPEPAPEGELPADPEAAPPPPVDAMEPPDAVEAPDAAPPEGETAEDAPPVEPESQPWMTRLRDPEQMQVIMQSMTQWLKDLDWSQASRVLGQFFDVGTQVVGGAISFTTYVCLAVVIVAFCFFYFGWHFTHITGWFASFIPASQRDQWFHIIRQMDLSISAFIRARLVQAGVMMTVLSLGWLMAGVPYWLLLGVISGLLNLVPFLAFFGYLVALLLTIIDSATGPGSFSVWAIIWPSVVYFSAQVLDGWVVEPLVQGKATNLDPLTILLVVMIGASLAGLLGMLIAIPVAACVKILASEIVLPRLRQLAAEH